MLVQPNLDLYHLSNSLHVSCYYSSCQVFSIEDSLRYYSSTPMGEPFFMDIFPWPKYAFLTLPIKSTFVQAPPFIYLFIYF